MTATGEHMNIIRTNDRGRAARERPVRAGLFAAALAVAALASPAVWRADTGLSACARALLDRLGIGVPVA